ncbi:hypothetical protein CLOSTMETH_01853 [[Clostridium] methylpentosum DSM 5476]|uniref:Uncharacterized protein n=1 Tax=[Clostridium] methylpentosum DSM 5476 TaxID=537013 RepID=C0EDC6_9FIRM|nr:hypothetical protein CLOSTMETH_01853 [[Clostridium] methylpentosum DSM 5476]
MYSNVTSSFFIYKDMHTSSFGKRLTSSGAWNQHRCKLDAIAAA